MLHNLYLKSNQQDSNDPDQIQIMSMHRAKGLEWDYVVIHDVTEGGFLVIKTLRFQMRLLRKKEGFFM